MADQISERRRPGRPPKDHTLTISPDPQAESDTSALLAKVAEMDARAEQHEYHAAESVNMDNEPSASINTPSITNPVYRWDIPNDSAPGYVLPIEITEAADADQARLAALDIVIGGSGDEDDPGRGLSSMERAYILAYEPMVVRDTTQVTLGYERLLRDNEALSAEATAVKAAHLKLWENGIDVTQPELWIKEKIAFANGIVANAKAAEDERRQRLSVKLTVAMEALDAARQDTGFAPPKPLPAPEPDYSDLTIVAPDDLRSRHPKIASNCRAWVNADPSEPLTPEEANAVERLFKTEDGVVPYWIDHSGQCSEVEAAVITRVVDRILAKI